MSDLLFSDNQRPTRADAVKNYALLLETARTLFDREGVESVTMSAIAREAGVGKGTLYRHFADKSAVCLALLDQEMRDLQERTLRRLRQHEDAYANLLWFMEQVVRFVMQNDAILCEASNHSAASILSHPAHIWWRNTIHGLLQRLHVSGDIDYLTDVLYVLLDVQTLRFQRYTLGYDIPRILDGMAEVVSRLVR
ncbi:MAG: TetR/AcrR family transcriptional regulator [Chloroflexi bacterium]|nr:MAG: TetR/AcrR family transcriptional regulator [Chloroflexota bacterium]